MLSRESCFLTVWNLSEKSCYLLNANKNLFMMCTVKKKTFSVYFLFNYFSFVWANSRHTESGASQSEVQPYSQNCWLFFYPVGVSRPGVRESQIRSQLCYIFAEELLALSKGHVVFSQLLSLWLERWERLSVTYQASVWMSINRYTPGLHVSVCLHFLFVWPCWQLRFGRAGHSFDSYVVGR